MIDKARGYLLLNPKISLERFLADAKDFGWELPESELEHMYNQFIYQAPDESNKLDKKSIESKLLALTEQNKALKKEDKKSKKEQAFESEIIEIFRNKVEKFNYSDRIIGYSEEKEPCEEELFLLLGDWHGGEFVYPEEVMGTNIYNFDIMEMRVNKLYNSFEKVLTKWMNQYHYKNANILLLGDMIAGLIHQELQINSEPLCDQILVTANLLAELIHKISKKFDNVRVIGVIGNHGRLTKKPTYKRKWDNFDYLVYKFAEARCVNLDNVHFELPKSSMVAVDVFGFKMLVRHGDSKTQSYAGIPFYGILRADSNITKTFAALKNEYINFHIMGHFHDSTSLSKTNGEIIINNSLKGTDEYSLGGLFTASKPSQTMFSIHPKRGKTWSFELECVNEELESEYMMRKL